MTLRKVQGFHRRKGEAFKVDKHASARPAALLLSLNVPARSTKLGHEPGLLIHPGLRTTSQESKGKKNIHILKMKRK